LFLQSYGAPTLQIAGELLDLVGDTAFEIVQDLLLVRGLVVSLSSLFYIYFFHTIYCTVCLAALSSACL
jgi:hypothetical protein